MHTLYWNTCTTRFMFWFPYTLGNIIRAVREWGRWSTRAVKWPVLYCYIWGSRMFMSARIFIKFWRTSPWHIRLKRRQWVITLRTITPTHPSKATGFWFAPSHYGNYIMSPTTLGYIKLNRKQLSHASRLRRYLTVITKVACPVLV